MNNKIKKTLNYAYSNVPIYQNKLKNLGESINKLMDKEWNNVPLISKEEYLQYEYGVAISNEYMPNLIKGDLILSSTSGSTGKCMVSFWTDKTHRESLLELWILRKKRYGICPKDRLCFLYSIPNSKEFERDGILYQCGQNELSFNKRRFNCEENIKKVYEMILEYQPVWMMLQPGIASLLARYALESGRKIESLKYIELTGEMLFKDVRDDIEEAFNCIVANQYGSHEIGTIAYECEYNNMHCMTSNVYTEVISNGKVAAEGEEGEIHVTTLINKPTPFVRYGLGDIGCIKKSDCKCGSKSPILVLSKGRTVDWVWHEDGRKTSSYVFMDAVEKANKKTGRAIKQFQVEQLSVEQIVIKIAIDEEIDVCDLILDNLCEEIVDDIDISFKIYNWLFPDDETGKHKFFINRIV